MVAWPWILAAVAAKLYGTKKQSDRYSDIKRGRSQAFADAQERKDKLTTKSFADAKRISDTYKRSSVDKATGEEATELAEAFSKMPRRELTATTPVRRGEPSVITSASKAADAKTLKDIMDYARSAGGLTASSEAFSSPEQMNVATVNRNALLEKARQQRKIAEILGLTFNEISDPYSQEAQMANNLGDVLGMVGMGAV